MNNFSLVPDDYKTNDPRMLAYLYPESIIRSQQSFISYNKKISKFIYYHSLEVAEHMASIMDCILVPASCIHWRRAKQLGAKRRVHVGRNVFYLVKESELTKNEKKKLLDHVNEFRKAASV